jgi:carbonic anhydrase
MIKLQPNAAGDDMPYIMNGGLPGIYKFVQLHFHWGSDDSRGSEHRIDGKK